MRKQRRWQVAALDAGHGLVAVEPVGQSGLQFLDLGGVVGFDHAAGQGGQFVTGKAASAREFEGELDDARLFPRRQVLDFFDDGLGCHME